MKRLLKFSVILFLCLSTTMINPFANEDNSNKSIQPLAVDDVTVVFDPDDGSPYSDWFKVTLAEGDLLTDKPTDPVKVGYTFVGWAKSYDVNMDPIFWNFEEDRVYENTTLWAHFEQDLTVLYDFEDGTPSKDWFKVIVPYGGLVTEKPNNPTKLGYRFLGWYAEVDGNGNQIPWDFDNDRVYKNTIMKPIFQQLITITFDPQNGTPSLDWFKSIIPINTKIPTTMPQPTRYGYKFMGWSTEKNRLTLWNFLTQIANRDLTLYAIWEEEDTPVVPPVTPPVTPEIPDIEEPGKEIIDKPTVTTPLPNTGMSDTMVYAGGITLGLGVILTAIYLYKKNKSGK